MVSPQTQWHNISFVVTIKSGRLTRGQTHAVV